MSKKPEVVAEETVTVVEEQTAPKPSAEERAERLYAAYLHAVGGISMSGLPLPATLSAHDARNQRAWLAVAEVS